ncbi:hypothetical protein LR48_Vigan10g251200 [Vigna angularis]|uniref:Clp1 P-loop domain-containing protein n=1 Tax=Phaseolus angularis TaxID=3914 RepID=A0A0L9VNI2_PHAAN|nr:hypothetical protein LR48_Vigan10g251200 [Vigna angularis]
MHREAFNISVHLLWLLGEMSFITWCLFLGDVSCKRDPSTYLNYVFAIYDYYQKEYGISVKGENPCNIKLPLIVNTSGWVKGVGYDVLVDMLKYISPTHVVKISTSSENKNLPAGEFWFDEDQMEQLT